jgi:anti-sigma regulatory factor (Ser/Thr protein kinase)
VDDALMVVSELVTNSVQHGPGGSIGLTLELEGDELTITVIDGGAPKDPLAAREANDSKESGRGLAIVEALSIRWGTTPTEAGTTVWAVLPTPGNPRDLP